MNPSNIKEKIRRYNVSVDLVLNLEDSPNADNSVIKDLIEKQFTKVLTEVAQADVTKDLDIIITELPLNA